jgi:hypothetical protein
MPMILSRSQVLKLCFHQKEGALLQFELTTDLSLHAKHVLACNVQYCAENGALVHLTSPFQDDMSSHMSSLVADLGTIDLNHSIS